MSLVVIRLMYHNSVHTFWYKIREGSGPLCSMLRECTVSLLLFDLTSLVVFRHGEYKNNIQVYCSRCQKACQPPMDISP